MLRHATQLTKIRSNRCGWSIGLVDVHIPNTDEHIEDSEAWYRIDGYENEHIGINCDIYDHLKDLVNLINKAPEIRGHQKISPST